MKEFSKCKCSSCSEQNEDGICLCLCCKHLKECYGLGKDKCSNS